MPGAGVSTEFLRHICGFQYKTGAQLQELYASFVKNYPVILIEDPFDQDDWDSYAKLTEALGKVQTINHPLASCLFLTYSFARRMCKLLVMISW